MSLEIKSYTSIDDLRFENATKNDAISSFGKPSVERKTRLGNVEYKYNDFILRFDSLTSMLLECTLLPYVKATINGIKVTWDKAFLKKICELDGTPKNSYGFIVLGKLGLAITGIHDSDESQLAITIFHKSELDEFLEGSTLFDIDSLNE